MGESHTRSVGRDATPTSASSPTRSRPWPCLGRRSPPCLTTRRLWSPRAERPDLGAKDLEAHGMRGPGLGIRHRQKDVADRTRCPPDSYRAGVVSPPISPDEKTIDLQTHVVDS